MVGALLNTSFTDFISSSVKLIEIDMKTERLIIINMLRISERSI